MGSRSVLLGVCIFSIGIDLGPEGQPRVFSQSPSEINSSVTKSLKIQVDFGPDQGQGWGSLWELRSEAGEVLAGAGFQNAWNTQDRSDRRMMQVYLAASGESCPLKFDLLPRPTTDAGTYLYGFQGQLFSHGRNALDRKLRRWDVHSNQWNEIQGMPALAIEVAGQVLSATSTQIIYGETSILEVPSEEYRFGEWYYADGRLIVRLMSSQRALNRNELRAYSWSPQHSGPIDFNAASVNPLPQWGEFIYCFAQTNSVDEQATIVAASNQGTVLSFFEDKWGSLRESDGTSFQIYSSINFRQRLLFGHYPTGNLFELVQLELHHLSDWPPVMTGVSPNAREVQTLAIYGGELYAGVWPWGELWRLSTSSNTWEFMGRLFSHPQPDHRMTHPYELETQQLDPVLNRWGQRITSMVPLGDSLYISTSAKGPNPYEEKFTFLGGGKHLEYGAVHRFHRPGCLSVPVQWKDHPTEIEFIMTERSIKVIQDGVLIGATEWEQRLPVIEGNADFYIGTGVFGDFLGKRISKKKADKDDTALMAEEIRGVYIHLHSLLRADELAVEQESLIAEQCRRMRSIGLTSIMPFVSTSSGKAHYDSQYLPKHFLYSDPVDLFASQSRKAGLQFTPVLPVSVCGGDSPQGILRVHPEWALRNPDGSPMGYISPAHPKAREWIIGVVDELVSKYQPDGLLLDYARYPNRPHRLDLESEMRFEAWLGEDASSNSLGDNDKRNAFQRFKEQELTELVRMISRRARSIKPDIQMMAYVWGPHVTDNHLVGQVWDQWVDEGLLDSINISGYCYRDNYGDRFLDVFKKRMEQSIVLNSRAVSPARLTFSLGIKTSHGRSESIQEILDYQCVADQIGMDGTIYFTWEYLQPFLEQLMINRTDDLN